MDSNSPRSLNTEAEIRELYAALDERDAAIAELERELERNRQEGTRAVQQDHNQLTLELEKHRDELIQSRDTISDLQIQVKHLSEDNRELIDGKVQLETDLSTYTSQVDILRSQLSQNAKAVEEASRLRKEGNHQQQRLELENQRLRTAVNELEQNEDILMAEVETLVKQKSEYQDHNNDLTAKVDSLYADLDEKSRTNADLNEAKSALQSDLECEKAAHAKSETVWAKRDADCRLEITKLNEELERERNKHHSKEYEANKIELAKCRQENQRLLNAHQQCIEQRNQAERDLDAAIKALHQSQSNVKEEVAHVSRKEHAVTADLKRQLEKAVRSEKSLSTRYADLEEQLEEVQLKLDNSERRNASYEMNHGLTEAVRHQKKLEADLQRRDFDIKQISQKLSCETEQRRALAKAVEILKEKLDSDDIDVNDDEIQAALLLEDNILRSENAELLRQVESLEGNHIM